MSVVMLCSLHLLNEVDILSYIEYNRNETSFYLIIWNDGMIGNLVSHNFMGCRFAMETNP